MQNRYYKKKILFVTGTRADYGKLKALIRVVEDSEEYDPYIFATGMHMMEKYGNTYIEILKDGYKHIYTYINQTGQTQMDIALSNTIVGLSNYIQEVKPIAIVVHGDRLEALAGAIVGAFNNIRVFHIEGGEVSGTIDESIRHAITKFAHYHLVSNEQAKKRVLQLGEPEDNIFVFGSPDIDVMLSDKLPKIEDVCGYYEIPFPEYAIMMYHPVTTEYKDIEKHIQAVTEAIVQSGENFVVIYPNNDLGTEKIISSIEKLGENKRIRVIPSMRFEYFLTLLKNAQFIIGNSSSGVREAGVYGVPAIDIGSRQYGRYDQIKSKHIVHVEENTDEILRCIQKAKEMKIKPESDYGKGNSADIFRNIILNQSIWEKDLQKRFVDYAGD